MVQQGGRRRRRSPRARTTGRAQTHQGSRGGCSRAGTWLCTDSSPADGPRDAVSLDLDLLRSKRCHPRKGAPQSREAHRARGTQSRAATHPRRARRPAQAWPGRARRECEKRRRQRTRAKEREGADEVQVAAETNRLPRPRRAGPPPPTRKVTLRGSRSPRRIARRSPRCIRGRAASPRRQRRKRRGRSAWQSEAQRRCQARRALSVQGVGGATRRREWTELSTASS